MSQSSTEYQIRKQMFEALYEDYQEQITRYLWNYLRNNGREPEHAEDICSVTFEQLLKLLRKETVAKQYEYYRNWLYKTANYRAIDYLRKKSIDCVPLEENEPMIEMVEFDVDDRLRQVLAQMPLRHQQCVYLIERGYNQKQIAKILRISPSRVSEILRDVQVQLQQKEIYPVTVDLRNADLRSGERGVRGLKVKVYWEQIETRKSDFDLLRRMRDSNMSDDLILQSGVRQRIARGRQEWVEEYSGNIEELGYDIQTYRTGDLTVMKRAKLITVS